MKTADDTGKSQCKVTHPPLVSRNWAITLEHWSVIELYQTICSRPLAKNT